MKSFLVAAACAAVAQAHGTVSGFVTDGTWNQGFLLDYYYLVKNGGVLPDLSAWYAENLDNGFVEPNKFGTSAINCHINAKPGSRTASVRAGGTVQFQWTLWPHDIGPVLTYVAACNGDCAKVNKDSLLWVKIDARGYDNGSWASRKLIDNNGTWTTTVPSTLAPGNYVFRHESTNSLISPESLCDYCRVQWNLSTHWFETHTNSIDCSHRFAWWRFGK